MPLPPDARDTLKALDQLLWLLGEHQRTSARDNGLTVARLATLRAIRDLEDPSPAAVAAATHLTRSTMTGLLDALEKQGWLLRERGAGDRRKVVLRLTTSGAEKAQSLPGRLPPSVVDRIAAMSAEERHQLTSGLLTLGGLTPPESG